MKFKIIIFIIVVLFSFLQLFWFVQENGNTIIYIQNHSSNNKGVDCSIIYEEKVLGNLIFDGEEVVPVRKYLFRDFGIKNLVVKSDKFNIEKKKIFFSLPVKWIVVNFENNNIYIEIKYLPPLFY